MKNEIIIGIGGLILSVLTYFAGVKRTEKRQALTDKRERMDAVFNRYMDHRRTGYTSHLHGLQVSGAATLISDSEIRELADKIVAHGEADPLRRQSNIFDGVDLKVFFDYAVTNNINLLNTPTEDVIRDSNA